MQLSNVHLRRIHWAIFSPSLLSYPFSVEYIRDEAHAEAILDTLKRLEETPDKVNAYFDSLGKLPMGKYFEQLLFFILERDERFEVIVKNYPVKQGKETIGEIDLIVWDTHTNSIEHWEIALKYYLQRTPSTEHSVMLGPNAIDSLDKKMRKLTEHQLPLSANLAEFGIPNAQTVSNRLFIKGQFFYHLAHLTPCNIFPNDANPAHERGWWCYLSEAEKALSSDLVWTTLWKPEWIGSSNSIERHKSFNYNEITDSLKQHFEMEVHSILCVGLSLIDGQLTEVTRGFVVNELWPNGSKKS